MRLDGKVIVITGAVGGIGLATAQKVASEGGIAVICDLKLADVVVARENL